MNTSLRIAGVAGALTFALYATAGAATVRLVPLTKHAVAKQTVAASVRSCRVVDAPALVAIAEPADLPAIAAGQNVSGIAQVRITLDAGGRLSNEAVMNSSGNRWLDQAALRSARLSVYSAEIRNCERVGGEYGLIVDFTR